MNITQDKLVEILQQEIQEGLKSAAVKGASKILKRALKSDMPGLEKSIKSIPVEEQRTQGSPAEALNKLEELPPEMAEKIVAKLAPLVGKHFGSYVQTQSGSALEEGEDAGLLTRGLAKALKNIPGGMDLGAMYLASLDRGTPAALRIAFIVALANLVSPVDVGTMLGLDFLGPLSALDDYLVIKKFVIDKYKKAGLPSKKHYDRLDQLAGEESPSSGTGGSSTSPQAGDYRAPREGPAKRYRRQQREKERQGGDLTERKIKRFELYKIIQEEIEVVLTNEEAEEMFDLDMSALLDEMMNEEEDKSFSKAAKEIEKKGTEGVFTAKADKAGMGVQAYAAKVLKKDSKASTKTKRQAAFAKGAATVARENK